jgi:hypothetical protein
MLNEIECDLRLMKTEENKGAEFVFTMKVRSYSSKKLTDRQVRRKQKDQDKKDIRSERRNAGQKNLKHVENLFKKASDKDVSKNMSSFHPSNSNLNEEESKSASNTYSGTNGDPSS